MGAVTNQCCYGILYSAKLLSDKTLKNQKQFWAMTSVFFSWIMVQKLGKLPVLRALLALNHIALLLPFVICLTIFYILILYPWLFWWVAIIFFQGYSVCWGHYRLSQILVGQNTLRAFLIYSAPLLENNPKNRIRETYGLCTITKVIRNWKS